MNPNGMTVAMSTAAGREAGMVLEQQLRMAWAFGASKLTPNDLILPTRPHLSRMWSLGRKS